MRRRFVEEYPKDLNAAKAAVRAGAGVKGARQTGHRWLTMADVAEAIEVKLAARTVRTQITADDVVHQLRLLGTAKLGNVASWGGDDKGIELVASDQLPEAEAASVQSVEMGPNGPKIKLEARAPYVRMLGEHMGLFESGQQQAQMIQVNIVVDDKREVKQ